MNENVVYVLSRDRKQLMPTKRFGHVRKLLKAGLAVPVSTHPFVIRLKYDTTHYVQEVHEGIDTGRENIGNGASLKDGTCVLLEDIRTNNKSVKSNMDDRRAFRSQRRRHDRQSKQRKARHDDTEIQNGEDCIALHNKDSKSVAVSYPGADRAVEHKVICGKEGKFNNRRRPDEWITPSARQLVQCTVNTVKRTCKMLPVSHVHVEMVAFDFQKLENTSIRKWQYGKGPLYGFESPKDYVYAEQGGRCAICGAPIEQYHHVCYQSKRGSDTVKNLVGLCSHCHTEVHNNPEIESRLLELKQGLVSQYPVSLLNSAMPAIIDELHKFCNPLGIEIVTSHGYNTKAARGKLNLPKDHSVDGYAISLSDRIDNIDKTDVTDDMEVFQSRRFKKKSGNNISARNQRVYRCNGKTVAYNRHKAMNQKTDSLEEYMARYAMTHSEADCRKHFQELQIIPARRTYTYHKAGLRAPVHPGDIVRYHKYNKTYKQYKVNTVVATGCEFVRKEGLWHISYGDGKDYRAQFCQPIGSGNIQTVSICAVREAVAVSMKQTNAMKKFHTKAVQAA